MKESGSPVGQQGTNAPANRIRFGRYCREPLKDSDSSGRKTEHGTATLSTYSERAPRRRKQSLSWTRDRSHSRTIRPSGLASAVAQSQTRQIWNFVADSGLGTARSTCARLVSRHSRLRLDALLGRISLHRPSQEGIRRLRRRLAKRNGVSVPPLNTDVPSINWSGPEITDVDEPSSVSACPWRWRIADNHGTQPERSGVLSDLDVASSSSKPSASCQVMSRLRRTPPAGRVRNRLGVHGGDYD